MVGRNHAIACWLACVCGCSPHAIDVMLVHSRSLVPEDSFERVTLRIEEADGGRVVHEGSVRGAALASATTLFDAGDLREGSSYVAVLTAEAPGVCGRGRAVGRSIPFVHESGDYAVSIQVGCADAFTTTAGEPETPRLLHRLATSADGEAFLVGGARTWRFEPMAMMLGVEGITASVERYDPRTGRFVPGGLLVTPRLVPAVVALPEGGVGVAGGFAPPLCESSIELAQRLSTATAGSLAQPRCWPSAVWLPEAERVVVTGGQQVDTTTIFDRALDGEVYDGTLRTRVADRMTGQSFRATPRLVPLSDGRSALAVGGAGAFMPSPLVSRIVAGGACGEAACTEPVPLDGGPATGLVNMAVTYVPCDGGGGAVYVLGGETGPDDEKIALDAVYCYRDLPGVAGEMVVAGRLPAKRTQAVAVTVGGSAGPRILVVGGTASDSTMMNVLPYDDALLLPANGCACRAIDPTTVEHVPLPLDGLAVMHDATVLHDGAVLVVGGLRIAPDFMTATATGESVLFVPDLAP